MPRGSRDGGGGEMALRRYPSNTERDFRVLYYLGGGELAEEGAVRGVSIDRAALEAATSPPHRMARYLERSMGEETDVRMFVGETEEGTPVTALVIGVGDPAGKEGDYASLARSFGLGGEMARGWKR